jgi:mannose-6-phosphate isomerase-like protein (cupin superfamily)
MNSKEILESGLLESYAMGCLSGPDHDLVATALVKDPSLKQELDEMEHALFLFAQANAITPNLTVKPLLMARVEYMERLKMGESVDPVPELNSGSSITDFERWLTRSDMQLDDNFSDLQIKIIAQEPEKMTAIVWLKTGAPEETHTIEREKFLIIEGTCDLTVGTKVHQLSAGDYLPIPLHVTHRVSVTSDIPCKLILQRATV